MSDTLITPEKLSTWRQRAAFAILRWIGWKVYFAPLPGPRGVVVVYPHTSNWDTIIGLLSRWTVAVPFRWLGKEALFKGIPGMIIGPILRSWGCHPTERHASTGAIQRLAEQMQQSDWFWLALAPEGTRSYRERWRSGFYHLALAAKVPLMIVSLDYSSKTVRADQYLHLTGDKERDRAALAALFADCKGLNPENASPIDW